MWDGGVVSTEDAWNKLIRGGCCIIHNPHFI